MSTTASPASGWSSCTAGGSIRSSSSRGRSAAEEATLVGLAVCRALVAVHGAGPPALRRQGAERHPRAGRAHRADGPRRGPLGEPGRGQHVEAAGGGHAALHGARGLRRGQRVAAERRLQRRRAAVLSGQRTFSGRGADAQRDPQGASRGAARAARRGARRSAGAVRARRHARARSDSGVAARYARRARGRAAWRSGHHADDDGAGVAPWRPVGRGGGAARRDVDRGPRLAHRTRSLAAAAAGGDPRHRRAADQEPDGRLREGVSRRRPDRGADLESCPCPRAARAVVRGRRGVPRQGRAVRVGRETVERRTAAGRFHRRHRLADAHCGAPDRSGERHRDLGRGAHAGGVAAAQRADGNRSPRRRAPPLAPVG